jgi:GT2 family glycosyltransferase
MAAPSMTPTEARTAGTARLSVVVPAHNNSGQLHQCLKALRASRYQNYDIIVVDDCSSEDLRPVVAQHGARYLRTPVNMGPAGARNLGATAAEGEILAFVDSDVVVGPDGLARMADDLAQNPEVAAVFGSYDEDPACADFISQHKNLMHHYIHQISSEEAVSFWAGCGAIRKPVFLEFGGFNAVMFPKPSIEDIELGYRMTLAGKRILLDKQLQAKHLKRWTLGSLLHADIFCRAVPWARLILETRRLPRDLNLTYSARLSAVLVALLLAGVVLLPATLVGVSWLPKPLHLTGAMAGIVGLLLWLNRRMYRWFAERRGYWFTCGVAVLHWLYYLYSGIAFAYCVLAPRPARLTGSQAAMPVVDSQD